MHLESPGRATKSPPPATTETPVALVRWPEDADCYRQLVRDRLPRVLVIGRRATPPREWDVLEDWVREPLDLEEVAARQAVVARRHRAGGARVSVDDAGVFRVDDRLTGLTDLQRAIVRPLVERFGQPVARTELQAAYVATGGEQAARALRGAILRLRRRIEPLGVCLQTLRGGALMLELSEPARTRPSPDGRDDRGRVVAGVSPLAVGARTSGPAGRRRHPEGPAGG